MTARRTVGISALVVIIVLVFMFSIPSTRTPDQSISTALEVSKAPPIVEMHTAYKNGTHTMTGSLEVPNPCSTVSAESTLENTYPQKILVLLTTLVDEGTCLQEETAMPFSVAQAAPEETPVRVLVNGIEASTTSP
jgi:hypothetical protein